ncbi:Sua5/YciO/YrdC/YwlC family protein [Aeromonas sp.]|uniref:Sua5/YciO/YrdC/YwlC family protein n=1 Tax=Aeromonas sp. TaxID=647 RepID=UPI00338F04B1
MDIRVYNEETHQYALDLIKNDGVIVAPSVTNYGVFCSATSAKGIARIFEIKERTKFG